VKAVARTLGVARSSLEARPKPARRRGRPPAPEDELLARIKAIIAALPACGYRRVHALLRREEGATIAQICEAIGWQGRTVHGFFAGLKKRQGIEVQVLERVRQVGPNKAGAKGSFSIYHLPS
jgi:hypothetical protein